MADADEADQRTRLVELQRRLYRRDATPADLERYVRLRDELAAADPPVVAAPVDDAGRRRRPTLVAASVVAGVALFAAVVLLQTRPSASTRVAPPTTSTRAPAALPTDRDGLPQVSARFTDDAAANPAGTTVEVAVDGTRVLAQRFSGSGPAAVALVTGGAPLDGGSLTVTLTSTSPGSVSWQADGGATDPGAPSGGSGSTEPTTVRYRGAPTPRIVVRAPAGTGWTLVVAFSR